MNLERWRRLQELFDEVLDLPPEERDSYIYLVCGEDVEMRLELRRLLAARSRAEARQLFEQPAWAGGAEAEVALLVDSQADPLIGKIIGERFRIKKRLGRGGFGDVYLAAGIIDGREAGRFVVKFARHLDDDQRRRFNEEVRINAELKHQNIVPINYWGDHAGRPFLVVEYVSGENLGDFISKQSVPGSGLEPKLVGEITRQACAGIQAAHDQGVIHRDIKPQNIMIELSGSRLSVKVIDFGLAKSVDGFTRRPTEGIIGSLNYIAPEQIDPEKFGLPGPQCDVYAMGLVIYEMLTGRIAVTSSGIEKEALFYKQLEYTPPPPGISWEVDRVVMKAISKMPSERQATISDLAVEMDSALARPHTGLNTRPIRKGYRSKLPLLAGLLALLLLGSGGAGWFYTHHRTPAAERIGAGSPPASITPVTTIYSPTPPPPVASSKLSVLVKTGKAGNSQIIDNLSGHVFTSRDELRFMIDPPGDGYIYLLQHGSRGDFTLLYPDSRISFASEYEVKAGTPTFFPKSVGNKPQWFKLSTPGVDIIYVVFATDKTVKLARLIEEERSRNSNKPNALNQVLLDKGIETLLQQATRMPLDDRCSVARYEIRHIR